ncbi:hypothetical protein Efla_005004 [Eimeria flavescens]
MDADKAQEAQPEVTSPENTAAKAEEAKDAEEANGTSPQDAGDAAETGEPPSASALDSWDSVPTLADLVDSSLLSQLLEMGFTEARAGRALLATKGSPNIEAALAWIESHEEDSDIDEPLTAEELAAHKQPSKTPLSEEEAQRLAYELQKKLREERIKREKQEAIENERLRLQQAKALLEQNAKLEEESRKRAIAQLQKEKEEAKRERERQRELLRQDYRDRFGREMPEDGEQAAPEERLAKMSAKEKVAFFTNAIYKRYKNEDPQKLAVCLSTLRTYCTNAKANPTEAKFHRIRQVRFRKENAAFKARVLPFEGSLDLLNACGFKDQGDVLAIDGSPDGFTLAQAVKFLDLLIGQLKGTATAPVKGTEIDAREETTGQHFFVDLAAPCSCFDGRDLHLNGQVRDYLVAWARLLKAEQGESEMHTVLVGALYVNPLGHVAAESQRLSVMRGCDAGSAVLYSDLLFFAYLPF